MWTAPPLVGSANGRRDNRRQPPFQYVKKVVPNWHTLRGAAAVAMITMRASVGCIANRIPEGFSTKSLRTTAEAEACPGRVVCARTLEPHAVRPKALATTQASAMQRTGSADLSDFSLRIRLGGR